MPSIFNIVDASTAGGFISTKNSSVIPLLAGQSFIGATEDVSGYSRITVSVIANKNSASNGFKIQFASNGAVFDLNTEYTVSANAAQTIETDVLADTFRIVFINGSDNQTSFRVQSLLHPTTKVLSIDETNNSGTVATVTKILNYNTGGGTDDVPTAGILLPSAAGAVAGGTSTNPLRVDFGATIRDLATNDALNVAIVNSTGDQISSFGGGTEYTVNDVVPTNPVGTTLLAERDDQLSTVAEAAGDWTNARATSKGALWVALADSAGDPITSFGGGTQYTEDVVAAADPTGTMLIAVRKDTLTAITSNDGDNIALRSTNKGEVYVKQTDSVPVTDNAGSLTVDAPVGTPVNVQIGDGSNTATIRNLASNDALNVSIVDGSGNQITTFGGGTQYTEDVAAAADPTGTMLIAVRADTPAAVTTTDGDNIAIRSTNKGELYIKHIDAIPVTDNSGSLTVDNGGTFAVQATQSGGWTVTANAGTNLDTSALALDVTLTNATQKTKIVDTAGTNVAVVTAANALKVDGSAVTQPVSGTVTVTATNLDIRDLVKATDSVAIGDATNLVSIITANADTVSNTSNSLNTDSRISIFNGATWDRVRGDITNGIDVDVTRVSGNVTVIDGGGSLSVDDNGSSLTVDNTTLAVVGGGTEATALRVTLANDSTGVISIDDNSGSITVDNAGTFAVQLSTAIPAGTNNIGDVDVLTVPAPLNVVGGGTEAAALRVTIANDSTGVLSVDDNGSSLTIDNATLTVTGNGTAATSLRVTIASDTTGVIAVTDNGSTLSIDDGGGSITIDGSVTATNASIIVDDAAFTPATTSVTMFGATFNDAAPDSVNEGDAGALRMSANRNLFSTIRDAAGNERGANVDASSNLQVVSVFSSADKVTLADAVANPSTPILGSFISGYNGATWDRLRSDTTNGLDVDITRFPHLISTSNSTNTPLAGSGSFNGTGEDVSKYASVSILIYADVSGTLEVRFAETSGNLATAARYLFTYLIAAGVSRVINLPISAQFFKVFYLNNAGAQTTFSLQSILHSSPKSSVDANGALYVSDINVDAINSTKVDDAAFTPGVSRVTMVGGTFDDTAPDSVDEGDAGALRMSTNRNLYTQIRDGNNGERGAKVNASGSLQIFDGSGTYGLTGDAVADSTVELTSSLNSVFNGATWDRSRSVFAAQNTTGTGVTATGLLGQLDDTGTATVTEDQFAPVRISSRRALLVEGVASGTVIPISDGSGSLTVDNAGAFAVQAAQSGTWTVQPGNTANTTPWLASIHDGTTKATVRDLASNDALNVAIVDGTGAQITSFGGGTQYTEDVAAVADPVGTQLIARRRDTLAAETTTDGDNTAVNSTSKGELYVKHVDSVAITAAALPLPSGASTLAEQQTQTTALQLIDDTVHAANAALSKMIAFGGQMDDTTTVVATEGNVSAVRVTAQRGMHVNLRDVSGNELGGVATPLRIEPTGTSAMNVNVTAGSTVIGKAEDVLSADADVGVPAMFVRKATPANTSGTDGDYEFLQGSAGRLWCSSTITGTPAVSVSGTVTTDLGPAINTDGSVTTGRLLEIGGTDGTNAQTLAVDTTGAVKLAAGTNGIGKLTANTGVIIGDVNVVSNIPGVAATSLGKAEDAAHTSGDTGVMTLAVQRDPVVANGSNNDYVPLISDVSGRLWVRPAPSTVRVQVTPTISTGIYASGDVIGTLQTITGAGRAPISGGFASGIIQSITVFDKTQAQRAAIDLLFFDRTVTVAADNAAVAMSDADMANCLGVVSIGPYNTAFPGTPLNSISTLINVGLPFVLTADGTSLFAVAVVRGTPTYTTTTDLIFSYVILQD